MHMDWTISLGNLLTALVFVVTLLGLHKSNIERLTKLQFKVDLMWNEFRRRARWGSPDEEDDK